ncbi:type II toxin-antitoxin system HicA family toxin [Paenibacillus sp. NPDC057967]|uniref:type II toxin-antitoxin system HicA family toxin n=1 Tax=Paenibacillus sp. NPDC057967 TaxID=3346293 RepID=UPI0036DE8AEA
MQLRGQSSKSLIKLIEADGWFHVHTKGDHWQFKHHTKPGRVTIPHPEKDLPIKTIVSILKQAGLK